MDNETARQQRREVVARELGQLIRREARRKWSAVRTAQRNARGHRVWRFQADADWGDRFLHVAHEAMEHGANSSRQLFEQLRAGRWFERLDSGPETALRLSKDGELEAWPNRNREPN